ncbi:MAG TPA: hypothetical protein VKO84_06340 [Gaiellaceae bacterium]|nr:hypothetical protein [Gaiellaceae bacterium]
MRTHTLRLYVAGVTLVVFFVIWAVVAARPWASTGARVAADPRVVALERKQRRLAREARLVKRELARRWRGYRVRLRAREARIRTVEQAHAAQVAAARAAAASSAAAYTTSAAAAAARGTRVVTLPPQVRIVTLPPSSSPATGSGSSHP